MIVTWHSKFEDGSVVRVGSFGLSRNDRNYRNWWFGLAPWNPSDLRGAPPYCFLHGVLLSPLCGVFTTLSDTKPSH